MSSPNTEYRSAARREQLKQRLVPEVQTALAADPEVRPWPPNWDDDGEVDFFYRTGSVLTRDTDLPRVRQVLEDLGALAPDAEQTAEQSSRSLIDGLTKLAVRTPDSRHTTEVVDDLDRRLGVGVATPEHAFVVTYVCTCPATEPEPVLDPALAADLAKVRSVVWPSEGDAGAGRDVRVSIVDTGLLSDTSWAPWLDGVRPDSPDDIEDPDQMSVDGQQRARDGYADPYAGHGTFVAGVLRCVAPATDVTVERVLATSGFVNETQLTLQLHDAFAASPDVLTMSAGGTTRRNIPPLSFETLYRTRLSQLGGMVMVSAAGNDGSSRPFWPAAFPWCVGVGSMSRDGQRRSDFSNHGSWVDVYAPGEDIVNAYPRLPYKTAKDAEVRDTSAGIVSWSGTSFSTPIVAGLIAARMSRTGENGQEAARALLRAAQGQYRPGVGPRLFP